MTTVYLASTSTWTALGHTSIAASAPPAPANIPGSFTATATSNTSIGLSWATSTLPTGATPVTGYRVYSDGAPIATLGLVNSYTRSGLAPGSLHTFQVSSLNQVGESALSSVLSATTTNTSAVPNAPASLTGAVLTDTSVSLTWTAATVPSGATSVTGYKVYRGAGTLVSTLGNVTTTNVTGLTAGTAYLFYVVAVNSAGNGATSPTRALTTTTSSVTTLTRLPAQPGAVCYGNLTGPGTAYYQPGSLVITSRGNFGQANMQAAAAAGAHVIGYFDALISVVYGSGDVTGRLINDTIYGPPVPEWPGHISSFEGIPLLDFRPTSPMHQPSLTNSSWTKLEAVLESIVAENPHLSGFFADDVGTRSWYAGFDWSTFGTTNQQNYRAGAILIAQAFRRVCDRNGMFLLVNGTWSGGALATNGGGYPDATQHGCSLADGGDWEHHPAPDDYSNAYFATSTQWGSASPFTGPGKAFHVAQIQDADSPVPWVNCQRFAWIVQKSDYTQTPLSPWGAFHPTGLPTST